MNIRIALISISILCLSATSLRLHSPKIGKKPTPKSVRMEDCDDCCSCVEGYPNEAITNDAC
ncbi:MAG TPA: 4Fe-4S ferredoxin [Archaeoglobaceae archaeon]|nr:4Fe-4S ferredoxin [Archaeoglobaceae archaeon]